MSFEERDLSVPTAAGDMGIFEVIPSQGAKRALIILHGAFGPNAHVRDLARRFSGYGYRTLAPNLYHRTTATPLDRGEFVDIEAVSRVCMQHLSALTSQTFTEDLAGAITHLEAEGLSDRAIGVVGFCLGGSGAFLAGVEFGLGATVSFYGSVSASVTNLGFAESPLDMARRLQTPYLGIFADLDPITPVAEIEAFRSVLSRATAPSEIVRYAEAVHGFHDDDLPELYQPELAEDAERKAFAWLDRHVSQPTSGRAA